LNHNREARFEVQAGRLAGQIKVHLGAAVHDQTPEQVAAQVNASGQTLGRRLRDARLARSHVAGEENDARAVWVRWRFSVYGCSPQPRSFTRLAVSPLRSMIRLAVTIMVVLLFGRNQRLAEQVDDRRSRRGEQEQNHQNHQNRTLALRLRFCRFQFVIPSP